MSSNFDYELLGVSHSWKDFLRKPIDGSFLRIKLKNVLELVHENTIVKSQEKELIDLRSSILITPLREIVVKLQKIRAGQLGKTSPELLDGLGEVISQLSKSGLYNPRPEKILREKDKFNKSILIDTLEVRNENSGRSHKSQPAEEEEDPKPKNIYVRRTCHAEALEKWDFNLFAYTEDELVGFLVEMFENFGLLTEFDIRRETLLHFVKDVKNIQDLRKSTAKYHSWEHLFDVTQGLYCVMVMCREHLTPEDVLVGLVSGIIHDIDHPGNSNIYEINAQTENALVYNDISVLENHHASTGFRVLGKNENNIFAGFSQTHKLSVRQRIIDLVLSTDTQRHAEYMVQWQNVRECGKCILKEDIQSFLRLAIKAADVGNGARPWHMSHFWVQRLHQEFHGQVVREKRNGLPVTLYMNLSEAPLGTMAQVEVQFMDLFSIPLFSMLVSEVPGMVVAYKNVLYNRRRYKILSEIVNLVQNKNKNN